MDSFTTDEFVGEDNADLIAYVNCYIGCFEDSGNTIQQAKDCAAGAAGSTCATEKAACSAVIF